MARCIICGLGAAWLKDMVPPSGGAGWGAGGGEGTVGDECTALAIAAESESLQLADDFKRERVVEFQHVHVGGPHSGVAERTLGRASADHAIDVAAVIAASANEIP